MAAYVDGTDLALVDPAWIRRHIGVVLQENLLFNLTIRENISVTDPGTSLENVIQAAMLAGAHEFISQLPEGYETVVGEHGATLSGATTAHCHSPALLTNPRILIFDEATSALDFETEQVIQRNMRAISRNRTVIIIAHRLSAVRHADEIMAMDNGKIVERGSHTELMGLKGYYWKLVSIQNAS